MTSILRTLSSEQPQPHVVCMKQDCTTRTNDGGTAEIIIGAYKMESVALKYPAYRPGVHSFGGDIYVLARVDTCSYLRLPAITETTSSSVARLLSSNHRNMLQHIKSSAVVESLLHAGPNFQITSSSKCVLPQFAAVTNRLTVLTV